LKEWTQKIICKKVTFKKKKERKRVPVQPEED